MKKLIVLVALIIFLLSPLPVFYSHPEKSPSNTLTAVVLERDFSVIVRSVGELDAVRSTVISSELQGDKGKIIWMVEDGARVEKEDLLVKFDPSEFEEEIRQLSVKIKEVEARVTANEQILEWEKSQAEREIQNGKLDLRAAKLDLLKLEKGEGPLELSQMADTAEEARLKFEKYQIYAKDLEQLREQGYIGEAEISDVLKKKEEAERGYNMAKQKHEYYRDYVLPTNIEKAKAAVAKAQVNLEQMKKAKGYKIGTAMANLELARRELESNQSLLQKAKTDLEKTAIYASIPGMAVLREAFHKGERRKPRIGDQVLRNQPILYLPDITRMMVKTQIREIDLHKVAPGKPAIVRVDAYPDLRLNGKVSSIGVLAQSERESRAGLGEKYFTLDILILDQEQRLRPGMTARVEIECASVKGLTVPVQAIFHEKEKRFCFIETERGFEKKEISVGDQNEDFAHIITGLMPGERVALSIPE